MKYFVTHFTINCSDEALLQTSRELAADIAGECGYETFLDTDEGIDGYVQMDFYDEPVLRAQLEDFPVDGVTVTFVTEQVEDQDWNETWEKEEGFAPINIDDKVIIYDANNPSSTIIQEPSPITYIGIQARNAFGTGTHETTQMIVSTLLSMDLNGKRVLDCGCGTGILAITALKCGASEAVAYDIDEWSAENSRHNARLNGVDDHIDVLEGDSSVLSHVEGMFDVVLANINRNILLADMAAFKDVMKHGARLILSGFYQEDIPMLSDKAFELGLSLKDEKQLGDWRCLIFE